MTSSSCSLKLWEKPSQIIVISLLILWWSPSKMNLTGNKLTEAFTRRPGCWFWRVKSLSGEWKSNIHLLIFLLSFLRAALYRPWELSAQSSSSMKSSSSMVERQNDFPIISEDHFWNDSGKLPSHGMLDGEHHGEFSTCNSFLNPTFLLLFLFSIHCKSETFSQMQNLPSQWCINKQGLHVTSEKNFKFHFGQCTYLFIFPRTVPFNTENTPELLKSSRYIGNAEVSNLISVLKRH